eukprot:gene14565-17213_t
MFGVLSIRTREDPLEVSVTKTAPIEGQKPGTSGLRKKTKAFMEGNYLANFVQSAFYALVDEKTPMKGGTLVISGDGRFYNDKAIQVIIKIAAAHGVSRIWVGSKGLLSTPAVSAVIRNRDGGFQAFGGFILTASHNPGGIDEDFGIKYNCENGGPAPEKMTAAIYDYTTKITEIHSCDNFPTIDLDKDGKTVVESGDGASKVTVEVFSAVEDHVKLLFDECFDKEAIKKLLARKASALLALPGAKPAVHLKDFSMCYDSMNGVQGVYAQK